MKMKKFNKKLIKENTKSYTIEERLSKDLAKEDALALVSDFVKDVKKKFSNVEDKLEILRDVSKTLDFYINEIENTSSKVDIEPMFTHDIALDTVGPMDDDENSNGDDSGGDDDDNNNNDDDTDIDIEDDEDGEDNDDILRRILRGRRE